MQSPLFAFTEVQNQDQYSLQNSYLLRVRLDQGRQMADRDLALTCLQRRIRRGQPFVHACLLATAPAVAVRACL